MSGSFHQFTFTDGVSSFKLGFKFCDKKYKVYLISQYCSLNLRMIVALCSSLKGNSMAKMPNSVKVVNYKAPKSISQHLHKSKNN